MSEKSPKTSVLDGHKKVGSKFIPPLLQLGGFHAARWSEILIPDLVWIALLNEKHGMGTSASLALSLSKAADATPTGAGGFFGFVSSFGALSEADQRAVRQRLANMGQLDAIAEGVLPLLRWYPLCPLNFLHETAVPVIAHPQLSLEAFKHLLDRLYDRTSAPATFAQAHAVYIALNTNRLSVAPGLALTNLAALQVYPTTEESQRVASSVRSTLNMMSGNRKQEDFKWQRYFWQRGLELEKCDLSPIHG